MVIIPYHLKIYNAVISGTFAPKLQKFLFFINKQIFTLEFFVGICNNEKDCGVFFMLHAISDFIYLKGVP